MTLRKWLASAALAAGLPLTAFAAEPTAKAPDPALVSFGTLRAMPADEAKGKLEAWLKTTGKLDRAKFDAVWSAEASVTRKTVDSIVLGKPDAKAVLDDARDITRAAPTVVPAVIADETDPFVKANLGAAYARALAGKKVYEEALDAVKGVDAELVVDPSAFLFFKAVAEHSLSGHQKAKKLDAAATLVRLLDEVTDAPDRYKMVATLMFFDLQNRSKDDKDLANIGRLMASSGRRLDLARGGEGTQTIQKRILFRLDEKIKELEDEGGDPGPDGPGRGCPPGGPGGKANRKQTGDPAKESTLPGGGPAEGKVDDKALREIAERWGTLPEADRVKIAQRMVLDAPPKYKPYVEEYFKALQNGGR